VLAADLVTLFCMPPKKNKVNLSKLASHSYVSERGLASVLKSIKQDPSMLEVCSRSSLKRSRDASVNVNSLHGSLLRRMTIPFENDNSQGLEFSYIHPTSMLSYVTQHAHVFGTILLRCHQRDPSDLNKPWDICFYSDEVTLGDPLSVHKNSRKVQAVYWSIKQLGPEVLACDDAWFVLTCIRSESVKPIGGLAVLANHLIETFFSTGNDVRKGLKLRDHLVYMNVSVVVQDYEAMRAFLKSKGASGILICLLCQNCISHRREDLAHHPHLVPSDELDFTKFRKQTDQSLADSTYC
jgi:hypothetical protein